MKFSVNDRVAVYDCDKRKIGKIIDIHDNGNLKIVLDFNGDEHYYETGYWFSRQQCRKIKTKKKKDNLSFWEALKYMQENHDKRVAFYGGKVKAWVNSDNLRLYVKTMAARVYEWHPNQEEILELKYRIEE